MSGARAARDIRHCSARCESPTRPETSHVTFIWFTITVRVAPCVKEFIVVVNLGDSLVSDTRKSRANFEFSRFVFCRVVLDACSLWELVRLMWSPHVHWMIFLSASTDDLALLCVTLNFFCWEKSSWKMCFECEFYMFLLYFCVSFSLSLLWVHGAGKSQRFFSQIYFYLRNVHDRFEYNFREKNIRVCFIRFYFLFRIYTSCMRRVESLKMGRFPFGPIIQCVSFR